MTTVSDVHDTRELRGRASEIKFLVDHTTARRLREWGRKHLSADAHGTGPWNDQYAITSLYFDTPELDVFERRGSHGRAKYRVRRYNADPLVFLERKLRSRTLLAKRRTPIDLDELPRVSHHASRDAAWCGDWFRRRIALRQLAPVCQVAYHRTARVLETPFGLTRLTIDHHMSVQRAAGLTFVSGPGTPVLDGRVIVEVKYRIAVPATIKAMIETFALVPTKVSKYRLAQAALGEGHVPAAEPAVREAELICA